MYYLVKTDSAHIVSSHITERGAKISKTRKYKDDDNIEIYESGFYHQFINVEVEVISLFSKKLVKIRKSQIGTCTDPSTERYYSM